MSAGTLAPNGYCWKPVRTTGSKPTHSGAQLGYHSTGHVEGEDPRYVLILNDDEEDEGDNYSKYELDLDTMVWTRQKLAFEDDRIGRILPGDCPVFTSDRIHVFTEKATVDGGAHIFLDRMTNKWALAKKMDRFHLHEIDSSDDSSDSEEEEEEMDDETGNGEGSEDDDMDNEDDREEEDDEMEESSDSEAHIPAFTDQHSCTVFAVQNNVYKMGCVSRDGDNHAVVVYRYEEASNGWSKVAEWSSRKRSLSVEHTRVLVRGTRVFVIGTIVKNNGDNMLDSVMVFEMDPSLVDRASAVIFRNASLSQLAVERLPPAQASQFARSSKETSLRKLNRVVKKTAGMTRGQLVGMGRGGGFATGLRGRGRGRGG